MCMEVNDIKIESKPACGNAFKLSGGGINR